MRKFLIVLSIALFVLNSEIQSAQAYYYCGPYYYSYGYYGCDPTATLIVLAGVTVVIVGVAIAVAYANKDSKEGFFTNEFKLTPVIQKDGVGGRLSINW